MMAAAGNVQGERLTELFDRMIANKTIISMHVVGTDFNRLTCITGTVTEEGCHHLIVAPPEGFAEAVADHKPWHLRFNFNGPDQLEYLFVTHGGSACSEGLKIPFPEQVERLQRRHDFRVDTRTGSRLHFQLKKIEGTIDLINVSLGGACGILVKHNFKFMRGPVMKIDQPVSDIRMVFPGDEEHPAVTVVVKQARVKRIERDEEKGLYRYAFQFLEMEKNASETLTRVIYDLQRWYLRRRK